MIDHVGQIWKIGYSLFLVVSSNEIDPLNHCHVLLDIERGTNGLYFYNGQPSRVVFERHINKSLQLSRDRTLPL